MHDRNRFAMPINVEDVFDAPDNPYHPTSPVSIALQIVWQIRKKTLVGVVRLRGLNLEMAALSSKY